MPRLIIAESRTSNWVYHLRELADGEEPHYGGLPSGTKALCGDNPFGWDVKIPLTSWGRKGSHIPERFCAKCSEVLAQRKDKP